MAASQKIVLKFTKSQDELFQAALRAIPICNFSLKYSNASAGVISASTGWSFASWGENIQINITPDGTVIAESSCAFPLQVVDWGKNQKNIENFLLTLRMMLN